jgi:prevent-host-death family protein
MKPGSRRTITAAAFKARCLALLDEVARTRETLVVTKRGRPVARLTARPLRDSVRWRGDLTAPLGDAWNAQR